MGMVPLNRRILYNRASADPQGNPWDPKRQLLKWDGTKWTGWDIPDYSAAPPGSGVGPFIMQQEGMGRLFALDKMAEGPFPEHYEPFETPLGTNPLHPNVISNPAARIFKDDAEALGKADKFPYVGTTYRLTEHFHYWTKHALLNAILQPEQFVEIGESLANKLGIARGRYCESLLQPWLYQSQSGGDQTYSHAESERQRYRYHRYSDSLGL